MAGPIDQELQGPINLGEEEKPTSPSALADQAQGLATQGVDPTVALDNPGMPIYEFKEKGFKSLPGLVNQGIEQKLSLQDIQTNVQNTSEKQQIVQETETYMPEQTYMVDGVEYTAAEMRHFTNLQIADQLFRDRINAIEEDTGFVGKVGDWVDRYILRQMPIGMVEDLTRRSERKGMELLRASYNMNPKEYKAYIESYITELSDEGFFTSDNLFALQDGFQEAVNAGYDPMATLNQTLAVLEIGGLVGSGAKLSRSVLQADSVVGRVAAVEGQEAAGEVAEGILKQTDNLEAEVAAKAGPEIYDEGTSTIRPSSTKVAEIADNNYIWREIREMDQKGVFGRVSTPEALKARVSTLADNYSSRANRAVNNIRILQDIAGNPIARVDLGKKADGSAYKTQAAAKSALKSADLPEAEVVPVDPEDTKKGFVIRADARIDVTDLADAYDVDEVQLDYVRNTFVKLFGSNAAQDTEYLNALANMGEAGLTAVKQASKVLEDNMQKIPFESKQTLARVFKELRDGVDADLVEGYTTDTFKQKFMDLHPKGLSPTKADMDAYDSLVQFEDAGWLMRANEKLTRYVKNDFWALETPEGRLVGKKVNDLDAEVKVYNYASKSVEKYTKIDQPIWRLDFPREDGIEFIANPDGVKVLDHVDVMGFNSGGRRINPKANHFVVATGDHPKAFLTSFSEKQAKKAVDDINTLRDAAKGQPIESVASTPELDDLVRKHNEWNTDLESWEDFKKFIKDRAINLDNPVDQKPRDGRLMGDTSNQFFEGESWSSYTISRLHRGDKPLIDYGGGAAYNADPVNAILQEFANAATHYTHRAYTYNAAASWVKRATDVNSGIKLSSDYATNDFINQVLHAEVRDNTSVSRKLMQQRSVIMRRLRLKGPIQQRMEIFGQEAREFIFDTSSKVFSKGIALDSLDPSGALMYLGFQSAFGFFNVSQFFMQGLHALTISAISPQGYKGAAMASPLRMAFGANPATRKLWIKRTAKAFGETEQTISELLEYVETSGRAYVDGDIIELGTGPSWGVTNWGTESQLPSIARKTLGKATMGGKKLLDMGLYPFKAGERMTRYTAMNTAFLEFKKKFPNVSPLSDEGRRWITSREQTLSFNMTATSRPMFQEGLMKLPTQWLSYSFRAMESIVVGRGLTVGERARLAAVLMPMYGTTGMGFAGAADYIAEAFGVEDPNLFLGIKYGFFDWAVAEFTPVETAIGNRLAPITAFTDLWKKIAGGEATPLELALGPSGEISQGAIDVFMNALSEVWHGNTVSLTEDAIQILRQPSGIDNISKGIGVINNGIYRSKTGTVYPHELKPSDGISLLLGFSPAEINEYYYRLDRAYTDRKKLNGFKKEMKKDFDRATEIYTEDPERGAQMLNEISTKIALSGFSVKDQNEIRRTLSVTDYQRINDIVRELIEQDKATTGILVEDIIRGD